MEESNAFNFMDGFRSTLERAVRVEEETGIDWSVHTIEYGAFKQRLKFFARRRSRLRTMLRESGDRRLSEEALVGVIGVGVSGKKTGAAAEAGATATARLRTSFQHMRRHSCPDILVGNVLVAAPDVHTQQQQQQKEATQPRRTPMASILAAMGASPFAQSARGRSGLELGGVGSRGSPVGGNYYVPFVDSGGDESSMSSSSSAAGGAAPGASGEEEAKKEHDGAAGAGAGAGVAAPLSKQPQQEQTQEQQQPQQRQGLLTPHSKRRKNWRHVMRRVSNAERNEMTVFLTWEMDKVQMFYLAQWQRLSQRLDLQQRQLHSSRQPPLSGPVRDADLGDEILELLAFCTINIVAARQILLRYDAFARTFEGTPMLNYYMKQVCKHPTSFRKILYHEELEAVADAYELTMPANSPWLANFQAQRAMFISILAETQAATSMASTGHQDPFASSAETCIATVRHWFPLGAVEDGLDLEPAYLAMRWGKSLTEEMQRMAEWRSKKHEISRPLQRKTELSPMQVFHLTLNLLSAFLYCMNYYIVEPSSTMYVNRLGAHDAMSGTLIGMMPLAAFVSSIPFSMWTNHSFRHPVLMSCSLLIAGNLLYSLADQWQVVYIALAGRFLAGLGAPKCIIRRYMADTTPVSLRTGVNAGFGMVVAAGSAMGPAMAIVLSQFEYTTPVPGLGLVTLNGLTLPGYFMACLWLTFTAVVLLTFEEPDREGLEEQKRLEGQSALPGSPTSMSLSSQDRLRHGDDENRGSHRPELSSPHDDDEIMTIFSGESADDNDLDPRRVTHDVINVHRLPHFIPGWCQRLRAFLELITLPVRLCLGLLFAKVFTIEALVSATSALSKNRYHWQVTQVGSLGFVNGMLVIPFSILVGRLSMSYQDRVLMKGLLCIACLGMFLLIDLSDLVDTPTGDYNRGHVLAVSPVRYIAGYFLSYLSIQSFEGVIGSTLSKVIPTALASGTFNSGLLATLVDTAGRACGDLFISAVGFINLRQLMNLLFIPGFTIMLTCLIVIERYRDMLSV